MGKKLKYSKILTKKFLIKEYIKNKKTKKEIAKKVECDDNTVHDYMIYHNIKTRPRSEINRLKGRYVDILTKEFLEREYHQNLKSQSKIAKENECSQPFITWLFKKFKIHSRTISEANNGIKNGMFGKKGKKHPSYIDGRSSINSLIRSTSENKDWRRQIFVRDIFTCQKCGYRGHGIEAHHKKPFAELLSEFLQEYDQFSPIEDKETLVRLAIKWQPFWDVDNGETLCEDCHKLIKK